MKVILDPHWRQMDELFSSSARDALNRYDVVWGKDAPIPQDVLDAALPTADVLIAASPQATATTLDHAPSLKAIIEVSGAFPNTIDYGACQERGVDVLSCAPGFRSAVAEMGMAMTLAATRGLIREHENFRSGKERWLEDCVDTDFTLFGATVGFVGFGQIAQEMTRLLAPFGLKIIAFDPWLLETDAQKFGVKLVSLEELAAQVKVLYVTAVPTAENKDLVNADVLRRMQDQSLVVILSRAHLVDFDALRAEVASGRLSVATDVFPTEPLGAQDPLRKLPNVILSPHRAAAVLGGRHLIGNLILEDLKAIQSGDSERKLAKADAKTIDALSGVGDADKVADLASNRS